MNTNFVVGTVVAVVFLVVIGNALAPPATPPDPNETDRKYHDVISPSVFQPLAIESDTKEWLKPMWKQINISRLAASKLAIDQELCPKVASAVPSPDPAAAGSVLVICEGGHEIAYSDSAIAAGDKGIGLSDQPVHASSYWDQKREEARQGCSAGGLVNCN